MIRVLHVIDHMGLGGAQTIINTILIKNKNHRVFALRRTDNQINFDDDVKKRVDVFEGKSKFDLRSVFILKNLIKKYDIEILHVHLPKANLVVYLYKLLFKGRVKVVINEHGAVFSPKRKLYRFVLRRLEKFTTCFIAVSGKTRDAMINVAGLRSEKVKLLYNFIDFDEVEFLSNKEKKDLRSSLGLNEQDFVVGFGGRLSKVKRIDTIIDAFEYFKDERTKLVIAGDGELREELEERANRNKDIKFLGFRNDMKKLYQIFDVIVLSSYSEASPMAFYESQVYGVPFVGSDVYAINEFIKDGFNGFLFKYEDSKELAEKIVEIRENKTLREKIKYNALSNLKQYDIKIYNKKLKEIYER